MSKYCAPSHTNNGHTCYTLSNLKEMARGINSTVSRPTEKISLVQKKYDLWESIRKKLSDQCSITKDGESNEWCWIDHDVIKSTTNTKLLKTVFRPVRPIGKNVWLTTSNIYDVMKQYESHYPDFVFFGPVPIDFK